MTEGRVSIWSNARVVQLKTLWAKGDSASQIAAQLGATRNAVLGKVWRLRLERRLPSIVDHANARKKVVPDRQPKKVMIVDTRGQSHFIRKSDTNKKFQAPKLRPGTSKTSATYRSLFGMAPETTPGQRRDILAEAVRNTAAMQIPEAS